jgi:hypothetical protein
MRGEDPACTSPQRGRLFTRRAHLPAYGLCWATLAAAARGAGYVGEHSDYSFRAARRRYPLERARERIALRDRW